MQDTSQFAAAAMLSKDVNSLVKRHVIRELVRLDVEVASRSTGDVQAKAVVKKPRIEKESEVHVSTSPWKVNGHPLRFQVTFEGKITGAMRERIDSCLNGELKEPLVKIVHPLGWKKIKVSVQEVEKGKTVSKYRCTVERA